MKKVVTFFCFLTLVLSCNHSKESLSIEDLASYTINIDSIRESNDNDYCIHMIIPLKTDYNTPINEVSRLIFRNERYFLLDKANKTMLTFDTLGNMIDKIHSIGNGPGEFVDPWDFDVDELTNIWLYDLPTTKLIKYPFDKQKDGIKELKTGKQMLFISMADSCTLYGSHIYEKGEMTTWLGKITLSNNSYTPIILNREKYDLPYINSGYFFRSLDNLYYYKKHGEYIYKLSSDSTLPFIRIKSTRHPTEEDLIECERSGHPLNLLSDNKVGEVNAIYETDEYIFLEISMNPPGYYVINKKDNSITRMKFDANMDFNGHLRVVGSTGKYFIGYYHVDDDNIKYIKKRVNDKIKGHRHISDITEESDPILVLFTFNNHV